jgi:hypothetical protein
MTAGRSKHRDAFWNLAAVIIPAGAAALVLWRFPPERYGFYPACPVRAYLHIQCPGCGGTRAIAALLHGHVAEALRLNGLLVGIVLPLAMIYSALGFVQFLRRGDFRWPVMPRVVTFALLGSAAIFTLARNVY